MAKVSHAAQGDLSTTKPAMLTSTSDSTIAPTTGGLQLDAEAFQLSDVSHWWQPAYPLNSYTYTVWPSPVPPLNPTEKAFRIVSTMMEQGIVGELTVKEFVALVNDVAEIVRKD